MTATKIPWATESWNPIHYGDSINAPGGGWMCTKISPGCLNCYAEKINLRFGNGIRYQNLLIWNGFHLDEKVLNQPPHWRKPRRVFVQSMGDLFHEKIPIEFVHKVFDITQYCPQHIFQVLTKRPERMCDIYRLVFGTLKNVWLGVTVENQEWAEKRIPLLLDVPAVVRFVSAEPLLASINFHKIGLKRPFYFDALSKKGGISYHDGVGVDWVIVGPETGSGRRPCKVEWIESIVAQCDAAQVPVFVKALPMGKRISHDPAEWPVHLRRRGWPK